MPPLSHRLVSIVLTCSVFLFFIGAGVYYSFSSTTSPSELTTLVSNSPETTQSQGVNPLTPEPPQRLLPTPNVKTSDQFSFELSQESTQELLANSNSELQVEREVEDSTEQTYRCFSSCEYSYQCPDQLECQQIGDLKRCVDIRCPYDTSCTCKSGTSTVTQEPDTKELGGPTVLSATTSATPSPTATPSLVPVPAPTVKPVTTTSTASANAKALPEAGVEDLTFALLAVGTSLTGIGLVLRKSR